MRIVHFFGALFYASISISSLAAPTPSSKKVEELETELKQTIDWAQKTIQDSTIRRSNHSKINERLDIEAQRSTETYTKMADYFSNSLLWRIEDSVAMLIKNPEGKLCSLNIGLSSLGLATLFCASLIYDMACQQALELERKQPPKTAFMRLQKSLISIVKAPLTELTAPRIGLVISAAFGALCLYHSKVERISEKLAKRHTLFSISGED